MPYTARPPSTSRLIGIGLIALLHVALIYALINTLAHRTVGLPPAPIETKIITAAAPPPAPPPPPPAPTFAPPPPPFVPPPEVKVATPPPAASTAPTAITTTPPATPVAAPATVMPKVDFQHSRQPEYPSQSRRLGEEGSVILQVLVDTDGRVIAAKLVKSSGSDRLDQAALEGIKADYRFVPGTVGGKAQEMWFTLKFNWKLQ